MSIPLISSLTEFSFTSGLLFVTLLLILLYYYYATSYHGIWEKVGVPGPKPLPVLDHRLELGQGLDAAFDKWFKQYGKTFGAYGIQPHVASLVTKDLELIKQILVKDFDNFNERYRPRDSKGSFSQGVSSATGIKWRRERQVSSPMFSGVKMKTMMEHVTTSAKTLTDLAKQLVAKDQVVNLKDFVTKYATEVIARVGFGMTTHAISKEESQFAYYARTLARFDTPLLNMISKVSFYFPSLYKILRYLGFKADFINEESDAYFVNILKSTMQKRRAGKTESSRKTRDMLDFMMESQVNKHDPRLKDMNSKTVDEEEIRGISTTFIIAGVETVATTFQSILYCLAVHPEVYNKVVAEIDQVVLPGETIQYEHLANLKYTEQVINECLRLFPILAMLFRHTAETKTYNGVTIPKGTVVQIPIGMIMKDPEFWQDPDKFDPDRFSPARKSQIDPMTFMPFGYGPRICLGMRLAMMELKVVLASLLKEVKFTLSDRTQPKRGEEMKLALINDTFLRHERPVQLEVRLRDDKISS